VLGFEPMTYGSESECATHYTTAPHNLTETHISREITNIIRECYVGLLCNLHFNDHNPAPYLIFQIPST